MKEITAIQLDDGTICLNIDKARQLVADRLCDYFQRRLIAITKEENHIRFGVFSASDVMKITEFLFSEHDKAKEIVESMNKILE